MDHEDRVAAVPNARMRGVELTVDVGGDWKLPEEAAAVLGRIIRDHVMHRRQRAVGAA